MARAQVSAFVILSVLIIAGVGIFLILDKELLTFGKEKIDPEVQPVYSFVESCIKKTGEDAVYQVGQTGGYYNVSGERFTESVIAYYFDGESHVPSKERVEEEISLYFGEALGFCTKNFEDFKDFEIKEGQPSIKTSIEDEKVVLDIDYTLSISRSGKTYSFRRFESEIPVRLGVILDVSDRFSREQLKTPKDICLSCLEELSTDSDLYIEMNDYGESEVIFSVIDENSVINEEEYRFYFANKY